MKNKTDTFRQLLAVFSHEIRAPLNGVIGFSEILMTDETIDKEDQKKWLRNIHQSSVRVWSAYNDIIDCSFLLTNEPVHFEQVNLPELFISVEETLNDNYWMVSRQSFKFILESDQKSSCIEANKMLLKNMLVWFFGENSSLCHDFDKTNKYFVWIGNKPDFVEISIANVTGGEKSFIHQTQTNPLWMEVIMEIVKIHSGRLVYKKDGNGKTFTEISLPLKQEK
jgi:light-regulated signal transduction histidine kinase (bacteriophytochrome)